ncbi:MULTISPECIES: hypothetical protein [unclassified Fusibacter]|uniref:hypothetical protein n=1 Tax=unclassified Fusibacter TaxID=2624464 RepID=UPI001011615D|nr:MULTISPECIES: hypothetical protein [unclassified Fusibacter]MCK8058723.1 hypothetical protein [Fusibacter sp. A2]NPE21797.1 hypothetical protein [Fusibacter sp. A1]RXV61369.1 hypothetical protein DWB64_08135 [Fusibacter sp. A1]
MTKKTMVGVACLLTAAILMIAHFAFGISYDLESSAFTINLRSHSFSIPDPLTKEDVLYLEKTFQMRYLDYETILEKDPTFKSFSQIATDFESLDPYERVLALKKNFSKINDFHTSFSYYLSGRQLPIIFDIIGEELVVVNAHKEYEALIGRIIYEIDGREALAFVEEVKSYSSGDNERGKLLSAIDSMHNESIYMLLNGGYDNRLKMLIGEETIEFSWRNSSTNLTKFVNSPSHPLAFGSVLHFQRAYVDNLEPFTYTYDKNRKLLLLHINYLLGYEPQVAYTLRDEIDAFLLENEVETVVFDFRRNLGGATTEISNVFIKLLKNDQYKKYSFVSRLSYSAGTVTPGYLRSHFSVPIIGEKTGYSPNTSGVSLAMIETTQFKSLQDKGAHLWMSSSYGDYDKRLAEPYLTYDHEISPVLEDFTGEKDSWLDVLDELMDN